MKIRTNSGLILALFFLTLSTASFLAPSPVQADFVRIRGTVVNVRQGPGTTHPVFFQAKQGEEYPLKKTEGLWCLIQLEDGKEAWVFARLVDVVPGELPGTPASKPEGATEEPPRTFFGKAAKPAFYLAIILFFLFLFKNRRRTFQKIRTKLMEASGYRREKPFRYDDHQPRDDSWDL